jgi:hypothetical protein
MSCKKKNMWELSTRRYKAALMVSNEQSSFTTAIISLLTEQINDRRAINGIIEQNLNK